MSRDAGPRDAGLGPARPPTGGRRLPATGSVASRPGHPGGRNPALTPNCRPHGAMVRPNGLPPRSNCRMVAASSVRDPTRSGQAAAGHIGLMPKSRCPRSWRQTASGRVARPPDRRRAAAGAPTPTVAAGAGRGRRSARAAAPAPGRSPGPAAVAAMNCSRQMPARPAMLPAAVACGTCGPPVHWIASGFGASALPMAGDPDVTAVGLLHPLTRDPRRGHVRLLHPLFILTGDPNPGGSVPVPVAGCPISRHRRGGRRRWDDLGLRCRGRRRCHNDCGRVIAHLGSSTLTNSKDSILHFEFSAASSRNSLFSPVLPDWSVLAQKFHRFIKRLLGAPPGEQLRGRSHLDRLHHHGLRHCRRRCARAKQSRNRGNGKEGPASVHHGQPPYKAHDTVCPLQCILADLARSSDNANLGNQ